MTTATKTRAPARPASKPSELGISRIRVKGYKSLAEETSIAVCPLTVLAGANSSGKSSVLQPLLLQKQTLESAYDSGALLLDGPHAALTATTQMVSRVPGRRLPSRVIVGMEIDGRQTVSTAYVPSPPGPVEIAEMRIVAIDDAIALRPRMRRDSIRKLLEGTQHPLVKALGSHLALMELRVARDHCFLAVDVLAVDELPEPRHFFRMDPCSPFQDRIQRIIHVPGLRGNPARSYPTTRFGAVFPGTFPPYVASIVRHWQTEKDSRIDELGSCLEQLGLTWKVEARPVEDTQVELYVGRLPRSPTGRVRDLVSIADVGFGLSQTLPVVVALLAAEPGQLVYIEQPELHLHPRAQQAMAQLLADAAKRGVRVVAETHSSLLLLAIQTLVAEGKLDPALTQLHWFSRDAEGVTRVDSAQLDEAGAYGEWPEDFAQTEMRAEDAYLTAASKALRKRA